MKTNLFTSYFDSFNEERQTELNYCLDKNIENNLIDKIYLIKDFGMVLPKKVIQIPGQRPTFSDYFKLIKKYSKPGEINIIANSDIFFDSTLSLLKYLYDKNLCLALSRSDLICGKLKPWHSRDSQDAWIFFGKPRNIYGDFYLGKPGSDNRIAYEINKAGYQVINLCKTITIIHVHETQLKSYIRSDEHTVPAPYLLLDPQ